jgi:penicillin-binding protein 1C
MRAFIAPDQRWRIWLPLESMDPLLVRTTLAYEDRFFYFHSGINPASLARAAILNLRQGRVVSGGSTLPMQLARIVEPKKRTVLAKAIEIFRASQFELRLGKRKILESYLNLAPYGGNVEGVGAACLGYFGRLPEGMTPGEAAFLVSLPQSPTLRRPEGKASTIEGRNRVLQAMHRAGLISPEQLEQIRREAVPQGFKSFPCGAPHFADMLMMSYPERHDITSTIDREVQRKAENIAGSYRRQITASGGSNASAVVIDNQTRKVRAAVGSLDYGDDWAGGQVRGFCAYRSPGSALKPFLYALALEGGVICPDMLIEDAPYTFGRFQPVNYSGSWLGMVRAEKALSLSLNMPFVLILKRVGYNRFVNRLRKGGLEGPFTDCYYGLPIITGGMEVRLLDLTNLYATLSRGGKHADLLITEDQQTGEEIQLFRQGTVWLTLEALSMRNRPDAPKVEDYVMPRGKVYWKTGTSFGRRDAWSLGFQREYTVGVWVGNFDGSGSDSLVGAAVAAPIMFDIIKAVSSDRRPWFDWAERAREELEIVPVCAYSGYRPGPYCSKHKYTLALKNAHPYVECPLHRKFIVEKRTGYLASSWKRYKPGEIEEKVMVALPPQVQKVLKGRGGEPALAPGAAVASYAGVLQVVSPEDDKTYFIPKGVRNTGSIPLRAYTSMRGGDIFWFINGTYRGATKTGDVMEVPSEGNRMDIVAQDRAGNEKRISINIECEPN